MPTDLASRMRSRIIIRRPTDVDDGKGGQITTWSTLADLWAEVISQSGREAVVAQALQGISAYKITIRCRPDISTGDQIVYDGKELNVRSADDPDGTRRATVIFADTSAVEIG